MGNYVEVIRLFGSKWYDTSASCKDLFLIVPVVRGFVLEAKRRRMDHDKVTYLYVSLSDFFTPQFSSQKLHICCALENISLISFLVVSHLTKQNKTHISSVFISSD